MLGLEILLVFPRLSITFWVCTDSCSTVPSWSLLYPMQCCQSNFQAQFQPFHPLLADCFSTFLQALPPFSLISHSSFSEIPCFSETWLLAVVPQIHNFFLSYEFTNFFLKILYRKISVINVQGYVYSSHVT